MKYYIRENERQNVIPGNFFLKKLLFFVLINNFKMFKLFVIGYQKKKFN